MRVIRLQKRPCPHSGEPAVWPVGEGTEVRGDTDLPAAGQHRWDKCEPVGGRREHG